MTNSCWIILLALDVERLASNWCQLTLVVAVALSGPKATSVVGIIVRKCLTRDIVEQLAAQPV